MNLVALEHTVVRARLCARKGALRDRICEKPRHQRRLGFGLFTNGRGPCNNGSSFFGFVSYPNLPEWVNR